MTLASAPSSIRHAWPMRTSATKSRNVLPVCILKNRLNAPGLQVGDLRDLVAIDRITVICLNVRAETRRRRSISSSITMG